MHVLKCMCIRGFGRMLECSVSLCLCPCTSLLQSTVSSRLYSCLLLLALSCLTASCLRMQLLRACIGVVWRPVCVLAYLHQCLFLATHSLPSLSPLLFACYVRGRPAFVRARHHAGLHCDAVYLPACIPKPCKSEWWHAPVYAARVGEARHPGPVTRRISGQLRLPPLETVGPGST